MFHAGKSLHLCVAIYMERNVWRLVVDTYIEDNYKRFGRLILKRFFSSYNWLSGKEIQSCMWTCQGLGYHSICVHMQGIITEDIWSAWVCAFANSSYATVRLRI